MKNFTVIIFSLLVINLTFGQDFKLAEPNISKLKEQIKDGTNESIYYYPTNNYSPTSQKEDLEYYDWDSTGICSFNQVFDKKIKYSIWQCKEAGGISVTIEFPKTERTELMKWIEMIYDVDTFDLERNVWKENNTKFEPKEVNPGCYYKIEEKENSTLVDLYCGC